MQVHEIHIEDEENSDGIDVVRWTCTCGAAGRWTPERERALVVIRGNAHTLRFRKKRPTKAQRAGGRVAGSNEHAALRSTINLGGF